jgi:hypothetical protein
MALSLQQFKTDSERETEGVWVDVGSDCRLLIARMNNTKYEEELRKLGKPYLRQIRMGTVDAQTLEGITIKATARAILKGWENLEGEDGKPIKFSVEKAEEVMTKYRDFFRMVQEFAQDQEIFRQQVVEEAEGNSRSS